MNKPQKQTLNAEQIGRGLAAVKAAINGQPILSHRKDLDVGEAVLDSIIGGETALIPAAQLEAMRARLAALTPPAAPEDPLEPAA